jgi:hypothetical protein
MIDTYFGANSEVVKQYSETLTIGKHQLVLIPNREFSGLELTKKEVIQPSARSESATNSEPTFWETSAGGAIGWAFVIFIVVFILIAMVNS